MWHQGQGPIGVTEFCIYVYVDYPRLARSCILYCGRPPQDTPLFCVLQPLVLLSRVAALRLRDASNEVRLLIP
jgi:hypothetical protein